MIADKRFLKQSKDFWAHVRSISEGVGYTARGQGTVKVPTIDDVVRVLGALSLRTDHVAVDGKATKYGTLLVDYFAHRASTLNDFVRPRLMDAVRAKTVFDQLCAKHSPDACDIPMNKQSGEKKAPNYLQAIINVRNWIPSLTPTVMGTGRTARRRGGVARGALP